MIDLICHPNQNECILKIGTRANDYWRIELYYHITSYWHYASILLDNNCFIALSNTHFCIITTFDVCEHHEKNPQSLWMHIGSTSKLDKAGKEEGAMKINESYGEKSKR